MNKSPRTSSSRSKHKRSQSRPIAGKNKVKATRSMSRAAPLRSDTNVSLQRHYSYVGLSLPLGLWIILGLSVTILIVLGVVSFNQFKYVRHSEHMQRQVREKQHQLESNLKMGFDVSHYQGQIDWSRINKQKYQFVYIKATEGATYQDPTFKANWSGARRRGLQVGVYHVYRLCVDVQSQLDNLIRTVPSNLTQAQSLRHQVLPPAIDVEYQTDCLAITAQQVQRNLLQMAHRLEEYYGMRPIFYTTPNFYHAYFNTELAQYPLWIQDLKQKPNIKERQSWQLWQYTQQGTVAGIKGFVDLNYAQASFIRSRPTQ